MRTVDSSRVLAALACLLIILVGGGMRVAGTDWDEGANLHPDERHMMFVLTDTMRAFDESASQALSLQTLWFGTGLSPLDPRLGGRLYVYGELPHMVVSIAARATGMTGWPEAQRLGRTIGAVLDSYTILAVFIIAAVALRNLGGAVAAAAFYAFAPLAIQHANFFTVDVWLTAATAWFLLVATLLLRTTRLAPALALTGLGGALAALAMACKIPGAVLCPILGAVIIARFWLHQLPSRLSRLAMEIAISAVSAFVVFRLASPFTFAGPGLFDLMPGEAFLKDYLGATQQALDPGFPPNWQWLTGYGPLNAIFDFCVWGMGPATTAALLAALTIVLLKPKPWTALMPVGFATIVYGAYWLGGPIPALRYMLPAAPALCVVAAIAVSLASGRSKAVFTVLLTAGLLWGSGMFVLHTSTNSRVAASRWLWLNTEPGTVLANESAWDDGLPVPVVLRGSGGLVWGGQDNHFRSLTLNVEYADSAEKAEAIADTLARADLLILSSERLRKPILALGDRFPLTTRFYDMMTSGELCFTLAYRNRSAYPVAGLLLDDASVQEIWSVYDHPAVEIYRRQDCFDAEKIKANLLQALSNGS